MKIFITIILAILLWAGCVCASLTPIARVDVVPYQRIGYGTTFNFGVVAFSKAGINRVEITVSGQGYTGGVKTSSSMTFNLQTSVYEYWVPISSSEFATDGAITVSAVAYGSDGGSRNIGSTTLIVEATGAATHTTAWVDATNSDGSGTIGDINDPFPTIIAAVSAAQSANGGTSSGNVIYLKNGTYSIASLTATTTGGYLTITAATGTAKDKVIINAGRPYGIGALKIEGITLQSQGTNQYIIHPNDVTLLWVDNCRLIGSGQWVVNSYPVFFNNIGWYSTNNYVYNSDFGHLQGALARNVQMEQLGNDAFQNTSFIVNCSVNGITNGSTLEHADGYQSHTEGEVPVPENRIIYGLRLYNLHYQGIFLRSPAGLASNNALVNVFVEMRDTPDLNSTGNYSFAPFYLAESWDHLLVWNCSFLHGQSSLYPTGLTNSSFIGNIFRSLVNQGSAVGTSNIPLASAGNSYNNEFLYNHYETVNGITPSCPQTVWDIHQSNPCPTWYAKAPDSGSPATATNGDSLINMVSDSQWFGYPSDSSALVGRVPQSKIIVDAAGRYRGPVSDIGAYEYASAGRSFKISIGDCLRRTDGLCWAW